MLQKTLLTALLAITLAVTARALDTTSLVADAWPHESAEHLSELGHGVGIVFSPDLSVAGNCRFYQALGFACFRTPST